ncbi:MAG: hypothetical protein AVDCRST_MAG72-1866 [uncultured Nocardioidaceae bacterium]|uniref:Uncharacterized protein n=1 Tax=uncultured Nocardioidaceae bacterium TaxID=253824 RepID=A0A6J4MDN4_9ACTN|nr:MAG: hypothetical protein AVDCRST_MAG72-1866 [uncultured Nocardioidaceae bacterium]
MDDRSDFLMLRAVAALCPDCTDERVFVPVDSDSYCCTTCDAAVLLLDVVESAGRPARRVA